MKILSLLLLLVLDCVADEVNERGTNAAQVANAGLASARNAQQAGLNAVPYLTSNSYMSQAFGIIGGILHYYHGVKMQHEFKAALSELNNRFDQLENDMNTRFDQMAAFIDRKQFESDVSDPTTILWGEVQAYTQYPNNMTYGNMKFECMRQTAWQIAMKIRNRLYGPDNTLLIQIKANQYSNSSFMATKDVIMFRTFQLMMVQAFCLGVEHGPNYNITEDWELSRMYNIYSALVNNTINMRIKQETEYLQVVGPGIFTACVTGSSKTPYSQYKDCITSNLKDNYQWDNFGVVVSNQNCLNDYIGYDDRISYNGPQRTGQGYQPYSVWQYGDGKVYVFVIRYWAPNNLGSKASQYTACMKAAYNSNWMKWSSNIDCGQRFNILVDNRCGDDSWFYGKDSAYFTSAVQYGKGISSAVWPYPQRPTTVAYDLGFWERPITIQLLPIPN